MCLFSLNSTRLLHVISGRNPSCENISVCKHGDICIRDSTLLILRQGTVGFTSSNCDAPTNQNTCYKKVALEWMMDNGWRAITKAHPEHIYTGELKSDDN